VLLRSLEQRVEVVEGSRAVHEVGDVSRLLGVDARRDVDQDNALTRSERSCATSNAVRPPSDIPTSGRGGVMSCSSAALYVQGVTRDRRGRIDRRIGVAVTGQVEGEERVR